VIPFSGEDEAVSIAHVSTVQYSAHNRFPAYQALPCVMGAMVRHKSCCVPASPTSASEPIAERGSGRPRHLIGQILEIGCHSNLFAAAVCSDEDAEVGHCLLCLAIAVPSCTSPPAGLLTYQTCSPSQLRRDFKVQHLKQEAAAHLDNGRCRQACEL